MKVLILPVLLVILNFNLSQQASFIPPKYKERFGDALEAIFSLGVRLQALLNDPSTKDNDNILLSPISASLLIGQLILGAEGKLQDDLYDLLSLPSQVEHKNHMLNSYSKNGSNSSFAIPYAKLHLQLASLVRELRKTNSSHCTLQISNSLFASDQLILKQAFEYESKFLYDTSLNYVNYQKPGEALSFINKWANEHTNGLIKNLLVVPPAVDTSGIFANAIYFKGDWEQPFSNELNTEGPFSVTKDKRVNVTYMTGIMEYIPYAEHAGLNCKMIAMPYKDRELGMYMVLPNKGHEYEYDIKTFASRAKTADLLQMVESLKDKDVVVKIPKLSLTSSLSLLEPLRRYEAFKTLIANNRVKQENTLDSLEDKIAAFKSFNATNQKDIILSGAAENANLRLSNILQQVTLNVYEKGTEAAAITSSIMDYNGGSKGFLANKPFLFFIRHEATGATLFWGTISNPNN